MKKKRVASTFNGIPRRSARLLQSKGISPALADSSTAPSVYVQSHTIVGDKTKECSNTRPARTSYETISASENTFHAENVNLKHQGRKESERDAFHSVTVEEISGAAVATIASNSAPGRQVAAGETRVISDVAKELLKDVDNFMTSDERPRGTYSIGLSEMSYLFADDDSNQDEVQSFLFDPSLVSVQGYRVKEASAPILRNVMEKHGDIAMNCIVETLESRSIFLEKICEIMQTLQTTKFVDITQSEVKKMLELVGDLGKVNLDVGWLQERLEEILEAIELIKQSSEFKESRKRNAQIIQESEKAMKRNKAMILEYKDKIQALEEKNKLEKMKMDAAQADDRGIIQRFSKLKPKVNRFIKESLLHDLP